MQTAVLVHGDAAVIQQIAVIQLIDGAVIKKIFEMALQTDAVAEREGKVVHDRFLGGGKAVGVIRGKGGEVRVLEVVPVVIDLDTMSFGVHRFPEQPMRHMVFGVIPQDLSLQLKLNDRNGLMHLGSQVIIFPALLQLGFPFAVAGQEQGAGVIPVGRQRKLGQRAQVDAVAILQ